MTVEELQFPDALLDQILERYRHHEAEPFPSKKVLLQLLHLAFFASIQREEGRELRFSLGLVNRKLLERAPSEGLTPVVFTDALPATIPEVVRLAPAVDPRQSMIALLEEQDEIHIAGMIRTNLDQYHTARNERSGISASAAWYPRITAWEPGTLGIGMHGVELLRYVRGRVLPPPTNVLLDGVVQKLCTNHAKTYLFSDADWAGEVHYHRLIAQILQSMSERGHGGTIVIAAEDAPPPNVRWKYRTNSDEFHCHFIRYCKAFVDLRRVESTAASDQLRASNESDEKRHAVAVHDECKRHLSDASSAIADLTSIDGAVVLSPRLRLLGFGAMFAWSEEEPAVRRATGPSGVETVELKVTQYGARHRSAFAFCHSNPGALAFVQSEDGPTSCILRVPGNSFTTVWRPVDLRLHVPQPLLTRSQLEVAEQEHQARRLTGRTRGP